MAALMAEASMTRTVLTHCQVPWAISPTRSGVTLTHQETDVAPNCLATVGVGSLTPNNKTDCGLVEICFESCYFARTGPKSDNADIECIGYQVTPRYEGSADYLEWRASTWRKTGYCPDPGFYIATQSPWLDSIRMPYRKDAKHYVIEGRDGYVEVIATGYRWRWVERSSMWVEEP
jgi:hypothetical protein